MVTVEFVEGLLAQKEGISLEFKKARISLPSNTFETVCAFLNRQGGNLLLGVRTDGQLTGVDERAVEKLKRDFAALSNNPIIIEPVFPLELQQIRIRNYLLLYVHVPQSSQVHRCRGVIFDRYYKDNFQVLNDVGINHLYSRKSSYYTETRIVPHLQSSDFKQGLLERTRKLIYHHHHNHPWLKLDNEEFFFATGLFRIDYITGERGYTLAAALLFGRDDVIQSILPHFRISVLIRRVNVDHFDYKLDLRTNLIDAYDQLMTFVDLHFSDPIFQNNLFSSIHEKVFREVISNVLIHTEYTNLVPTRFVIYSDRIEVENANKSINYGLINTERFYPVSKNPAIAKFFVSLGRANEVGSGILNIVQYTQGYTSSVKLEFIEEDLFRTIIPLPNSLDVNFSEYTYPNLDYLIEQVESMNLGYSASNRIAKELGIFASVKVLLASQIADMMGVTIRTIRRDFEVLRAAGLIEYGEAYGTYQLSLRKWT